MHTNLYQNNIFFSIFSLCFLRPLSDDFVASSCIRFTFTVFNFEQKYLKAKKRFNLAFNKRKVVDQALRAFYRMVVHLICVSEWPVSWVLNECVCHSLQQHGSDLSSSLQPMLHILICGIHDISRISPSHFHGL